MNILNYYMGSSATVADNVIATVVTAIALLAVSVRMCCWCDDDDISTSFEDDAEEEEEEEEEDGAEDGDAAKMRQLMLTPTK